MFAVEKIQEGLTGLVAVREPLNPDIDVLNDDQYIASSGLYLDDVEHFRLDYWIDGQSYAKAESADYETLWSQLEKASIANVMARVFNKPTYIDRNLIYSNTFDRHKLVTLSNDPVFYGYEIQVSDRKNLAFMISNVRIEGKTNEDDNELTIQLFHSSQAAPLKTIDIVLTNDGTLQMERLDWYIDNSDNYYKGRFYIGYGRPDFEFTPYERDFNNANVPNDISELCIRRIERLGDFADLSQINYTSQHNGLNFDITVYEDYTDLILQNKFIFARAIQLQWAMSVMLMCLSSNRSNRNERVIKEMLNLLMLTVEGQRGFGLQKVTGIRDTLSGELARLGAEVESIINGYFTQEITMTTLT